MVVVDDWSGFYVGAEAGYGWGRQRFEGSLLGGAIDPFEVVTASFPEVSPGFRQDNVSQVLQPNLGAPLSTLNQRGWLAGAFFGAQKQWGSLVLGIDVDIDAVSVKGRVDAIAVHTSSLDVILVERQILTGPQGFQVGGASFPQIREFVSSRVVGGAPNATVTQTSTITSKLDQLGTLRGKIGFGVSREWMIYGTGGLAWAHTATTLTATQTVTGIVVGLDQTGSNAFFPFSTNSTSVSAQNHQTLIGWSVGAGLDWKLTPNIVLGALYLHYEFPNHTLAFGDDGGRSFNLPNTRQSAEVMKARLSYLIPIH